MNTRANPQPVSTPPNGARQSKPAKRISANAKNLKASTSKKPTSKKRKGPGPHPSTTEEQYEKRQKQNTLTQPIRNSSPENEVNTSILTADTSSTYLDTEALEMEEQRQRTPSRRSQFITMSPAANIVTVGIRRGAPSSAGSQSSIYPSSSASQRAVSPRISVSQASSPLRFELESSPLRFGRTDRSEPHTPTNQLQVESANTKSKTRYGNRSVLGPGDLKVTAVLETSSRMLEKYLLSKNPFPTETELLAVMYTDPRFIF